MSSADDHQRWFESFDLKKIFSRAKKASSPRKSSKIKSKPEQQHPPESQNDNDDAESTDFFEQEAKKLKESEVSRLARISRKIVEDVNAILAKTNCDVRLDTSQVHISAENEILTASVLCPLCNPIKAIRQHTTKYSVDVYNYKRHFMRVHLKGAKLEEGAKLKQENHSEGNFFVPEPQPMFQVFLPVIEAEEVPEPI